MQKIYYQGLFIFKLLIALLPANGQVDSLRVYFIGNSVTENIKPEAFESIVKSSDKQITWGWNVIYGQALSYIWEHSGEGFIEPPYNGFENALSNYQWDALTLQPYKRKISNSDGDLASTFKFLNYAKAISPEIQVYIYQRWPRLPADIEPTAETWDSLWLRAYNPDNSVRYDSRDFFEKLIDTIRLQQTDTKKCLMIPVGEVMYRLNQKMKNGQMPGYSNIWEVYYDDIHMKGVGSYIIAATFYATLYRSDPRGISMPGIYGFLNQEQRTIIQQAIYETITDYKDDNDENWSGVQESINGVKNDFMAGTYTILQSANHLNIVFNAPFDQSKKRIQLYSITGQLVQSQISTKECTLNPPKNGLYFLCIEDITEKTIFPTHRIIAK